MSGEELLRVELLLAQSLAASRERQNDTLAQYFDVAIEIANFWRSKAPDRTEYPAELAAKIEALKSA
jgi:hypothetical protein